MNIKIIKDKRFKEVIVTVNFMSKLNRDTFHYKYLMADLFSDVCKAYPTKLAAMHEVSCLYGTSLLTNTSIDGEGITFSLSTQCINSRYVKNDFDLLEGQIKLMSEYLLHPLCDNECFNQDVFEEAKRMCIAKLERKLDSPDAYALFKILEIAGNDDPFGLIPQFKIDQFKTLDNKKAYQFYLDMLENNRIDFIICGDVEEKHAEALLNKYFHFKDGGNTYCEYETSIKSLDSLYFGSRDINQTNIVLLYNAPFDYYTNDYYAYLVGVYLLGLDPSSLLFQEVREKHSLCYSIASVPIVADHLMYISTGVAEKDIKQTIELSQIQVERVKTGDYDADLIKIAKQMIINSYRRAQENNEDMVARTYREITIKRTITIDQVKKYLETITKDDISKVFDKVVYISGYVLSKNGAAAWKE